MEWQMYLPTAEFQQLESELLVEKIHDLQSRVLSIYEKYLARRNPKLPTIPAQASAKQFTIWLADQVRQGKLKEEDKKICRTIRELARDYADTEVLELLRRRHAALMSRLSITQELYNK